MNRHRTKQKNNKAGKSKNWIPQDILKKILPRKRKTPQAFELVYGQLREMILKGKLRRGTKVVSRGDKKDVWCERGGSQQGLCPIAEGKVDC